MPTTKLFLLHDHFRNVKDSSAPLSFIQPRHSHYMGLAGVIHQKKVMLQGSYSDEGLHGMQVAEGEFEGLEGTQKAIATWDIDQKDPSRMNVTFVGSKLMPTHPEDLDRWKAAFAEHNTLVGHCQTIRHV